MSSPWTPAEKATARAQYDRALKAAEREYLELHRNHPVRGLEDLWKLELQIREWRRELDDIFQYSYSKLEFVFAISVRRGWLTLENLSGLSRARLERLRQLPVTAGIRLRDLENLP